MGTASEIVAKLNLKPHPEGGFYSETFRDKSVHLSKSHLPPECKLYFSIMPPLISLLYLRFDSFHCTESKTES